MATTFVVVGKMTDTEGTWNTRVYADDAFDAINTAVIAIEPDDRGRYEITGVVNTDTGVFTSPCDDNDQRVCMASDYPIDGDDC